MKNIIILLIAMISFSAMAQNANGNGPQDAESITKLYKYKLILNDVQEVAFKQKVQQFLTERQSIQSQYSGEERQDFLMVVDRNEIAAMESVLSPYQYEEYKKLHKVIQPIAN